MIAMNPESDKMVSKKPPLPPKRSQCKIEQSMTKESPNKRKRCDENMQKLQKLTAINDRLNIDIVDLRRLLHNEKLAVRELR